MDPKDAKNKQLTWSTSDPAVATVSSSGGVTRVGPGNCVITAESSNGVTATCSVRVPQTVTQVIVDQKDIKMKVGEKIQLTATVLPEEIEDGERNVKWVSTHTGYVKIDENGVATAMGEKGTVLIWAQSIGGSSCKGFAEITIE